MSRFYFEQKELLGHSKREKENDTLKFMQQSGEMQGQYLEDCLGKFIRGCRIKENCQSNTIYGLSMPELLGLVGSWLHQNKNQVSGLFYRTTNENGQIELPRVYYQGCPKDTTHEETRKDLAGRVICNHSRSKMVCESMLEDLEAWEEETGQDPIDYFDYDLAVDDLDVDPSLFEPGSRFAGFYTDQETCEEYCEGPKTEKIVQLCGALISEKDRVLPLETVLSRIGEGQGILVEDVDLDEKHYGRSRFIDRLVTEFPGNHNLLAEYIESWYEQSLSVMPPLSDKDEQQFCVNKYLRR